MSASEQVKTGPINPEQNDTVSALQAAEVKRSPWWRSHRMWWLLGFVIISIPVVLMRTSYDAAVSRWIPETVSNPSSFNRKQSGSSGLYELAEKLKLPVAHWQYPYRELNDKLPDGTLVIIGPWEPPTQLECKEMSEWLRKGNELIYMDDFTVPSAHTPLYEFHLDPAYAVPIKEKDVEIDRDAPEMKFVDNIKVSVTNRLRGGQSLAWSAGSVLTSANVGDGRVLVCTDPEFCSNDRIADPTYKGNFQFMANWLAEAKHPIYFDEKCHGYLAANNVFIFMLKSPIGYMMLQLLIILCVAFVSLNQRFAAALTVSQGRRISNLEFIDGLAATYRRARARTAAWAMMFTPFKSRLRRQLGVAPHESMETLAAAWSEASGGSANEYLAFLQRAQAAADAGRITESELADLVSTCDRLAGGPKEVAPLNRIMGA